MPGTALAHKCFNEPQYVVYTSELPELVVCTLLVADSRASTLRHTRKHTHMRMHGAMRRAGSVAGGKW